MRKLATLTLLLLMAVVGCEETPTDLTTASPAEPTVEATTGGPAAASSSMTNSDAPFKNWHQGFEHSTHPWNLFTGPADGGGWCGEVERVDRRSGAEPAPSAGRGYALVEHGRCVSRFQPQTSAPSSGPFPPLMSSTFPPSGFVHQLDVYLEPGYPAGADGPDYDDPEEGTVEGLVYAPDGSLAESDEDVVFTYAVSLCVLNEDGSCPLPFGLRYFSVAVTKDGAALDVAGQTVTEPGWYTFRYVFGSDEDGRLTVDFQLVDDGRPLFTEPVETTMAATPFSPITETSSFEVDDLGSGYLWFASIADGLELPVDEHVLRPGR